MLLRAMADVKRWLTIKEWVIYLLWPNRVFRGFTLVSICFVLVTTFDKTLQSLLRKPHVIGISTVIMNTPQILTGPVVAKVATATLKISRLRWNWTWFILWRAVIERAVS